MKKQTYLWLTLVFTGMLIIHLSFNVDSNSLFGKLCYAQESDPARERIFKEAEDALQEAEAEDVILLSPGNYLKAIESYQKALDDYRKGESSEKIREQLNRTIEYIDAGFEKAELSRTVLEGLIQTRKEAKALEIPERAAYIFSEAESRFSEAAMKVEDGDLQSARSIARDAERKYKAAVVEALEKFVLANALERLKNVETTTSKESYRKAKSELDNTRRFIQTQGATDFVIGEFVAEVHNRIQQALAITQAKPCDLTIEGLALSPENPLMGEDAVISSLVKNVGSGSAEKITVVFLTEAEREVGRATIERLDPAQTKEVRVTTTVPKLDQYVVIARVDPENLIAESDERNNESQRSFAVGSPGSPVWIYVVLSCVVGLLLGSGVTFFAVKPRKKAQVAGEVSRVAGRVLESDGTPVSGAVVEAFDRRPGGEVLLGETTTDEEGRYEVKYSVEEPVGAEKKQPDVVIRLYGREERDKDLPEIVHDATEAETAALVPEGQEHVELSEYQHLVNTITPLLQDAELAELVARIAYLGESARLEEKTQVLPEAFYGLFRQNLPTSLPALLAESPDVLRTALETAINHNIVSATVRDSIDSILEQLQRLAAEHVREPRELVPPKAASLDDLLSALQDLARLDVNSWLEFINTLIPDDGNILLVFSVDSTSELQDSLDNGNIPDELRQRYADSRLPLSDDATISPEEAGRRWLITDDGRVYAVSKEEGKLNIYMIRKAPVPRITKGCIGCGDCVQVCPVKAIQLIQRGDKGRKAVVDLGICVSCFCCHEVCKYDGVEPYIPMLWPIYRSRTSDQASTPS